MATSLVLTVIGPDRPGIVSALSDAGKRFGANWAGSRMASLAGQFAGIVHFEVPDGNAAALAAELRGLSTQGLQVVIAEGAAKPGPAGQRTVRLDLVGNDRPGIVRELSAALARRGVSIVELETSVVSAPMSADRLFEVDALLAVPGTLADDELKRELEALATEMMVDVELDAPGAAARR